MSRMCPASIFLLWAFFYSVTPNCLAETQAIKVYLNENIDQRGKKPSIDPVDDLILRFIEKETGLQFERHMVPWTRAKLLSKNGEGFIYGFSKGVERVKEYDFSVPFAEGKVWAVTYDDAPIIQSISDLNKKLVSIGRGYSYGIDFEIARNSKSFHVVEDAPSLAFRLRRLKMKRVDVVLIPVGQSHKSEDVANYLFNLRIPKLNDPDLIGAPFKISTTHLFVDSIHLATGKGKLKKELELINNAILRGNRSGELRKLTMNYY